MHGDSCEATQGVQTLVRSIATENSPDIQVCGLLASHNAHAGFTPYRSAPLLPKVFIFGISQEKPQFPLQFFSCCDILWMRHSLIISSAGILLVKMYAWSSYPAGSELCRNRTKLRFSARSFDCALFYFPVSAELC